MSGTSCDGLDLCLVTFDFKEQNYTYKIHKALMVDYPLYFQKKLKEAIHLSGLDLIKLSVEWTDFLVNAIQNNFDRNEYDLISSHGHTVFHQPHLGFTYQIGNLDKIAAHLNCDVVGDFRPMDVALGGQGAPLVPIGDELLFSEFDYCLNLGGFSNVSFNENGNRIAFDISPVNTVLNFYANKLGFSYDDAGNFAKSGNINQDLLQQLNDLEFYALPYPKSLGMEFVNAKIFPLMNSYSIDVKDKLCTFVEHIAIQIANICSKPNAKLFITGGGAYNRFLIERLRNYLPTTELVIPDDKTIQFKEALIFGFLGVLRLRDEINVLSSVTGASKNHSSGVVFN